MKKTFIMMIVSALCVLFVPSSGWSGDRELFERLKEQGSSKEAIDNLKQNQSDEKAWRNLQRGPTKDGQIKKNIPKKNKTKDLLV